MLTIFSIPKPFVGRIATIQRNAIASWSVLRPACEVILCGDEAGTAGIAAEFGAKHISDIRRNEFGTPMLDDAFEKVEASASHPLLCYANSDIILLSDLPKGVDLVARRKRAFLMAGQRWDVEVKQPLDFGPGWEERFRSYLVRNGQLHDQTGLDYFVFPRGAMGKLPPFAVGRAGWDNWFIYRARSLGIPVVDATGAVTVAHQNHDYGHRPGGKEEVYHGEEAMRHLQMAGGLSFMFTLQDCTHRLTRTGPRLDLRFDRLSRRIDVLPLLHPRLRFIKPVLRVIAWFSRPVRRRIYKTFQEKDNPVQP
jgi:hypothetical protein